MIPVAAHVVQRVRPGHDKRLRQRVAASSRSGKGIRPPGGTNRRRPVSHGAPTWLPRNPGKNDCMGPSRERAMRIGMRVYLGTTLDILVL